MCQKEIWKKLKVLHKSRLTTKEIVEAGDIDLNRYKMQNIKKKK